MNVQDTHHIPLEKVAIELETHLENGLSQAEAQARVARLGSNELMERPRPGFWKLLLDQFNNFLIIILIVAAAISLSLGEVVDASAIMAIVVLNAVLGVVQESKAEQALAALKKMAAPNALVIRDGDQVSHSGARTGAGRHRAAGSGQLCAGRLAPGRKRQPQDR